MRGSGDTVLGLELSCRTRQSLLATTLDWSTGNAAAALRREVTIGELLDGRLGLRIEGVSTSVVVHRAVLEAAFALVGGMRHPDDFAGPACYYLRVVQENGQLAWSSPIWLEG